MNEGCLAWQRDGLSPPQAVRDATAAYLEAEDATSVWLDEHCSRDRQAWTSSTGLFACWKAWAEPQGEHVGSVRRFAQNLEVRGFQPIRRTNGRAFQGLGLNRR